MVGNRLTSVDWAAKTTLTWLRWRDKQQLNVSNHLFTPTPLSPPSPPRSGVMIKGSVSDQGSVSLEQMRLWCTCTGCLCIRKWIEACHPQAQLCPSKNVASGTTVLVPHFPRDFPRGDKLHLTWKARLFPLDMYKNRGSHGEEQHGLLLSSCTVSHSTYKITSEPVSKSVLGSLPGERARKIHDSNYLSIFVLSGVLRPRYALQRVW